MTTYDYNFKERVEQHCKVGATQLSSLKLFFCCLSLYCLGFQLALINVIFCCHWLFCSVARVWCWVSSACSAFSWFPVAVLPVMLVSASWLVWHTGSCLFSAQCWKYGGGGCNYSIITALQEKIQIKIGWGMLPDDSRAECPIPIPRSHKRLKRQTQGTLTLTLSQFLR